MCLECNRYILETLKEGRHLVTWVVEPDRGMYALCQHAGVSSKRGSRTRPDGVLVRWAGAGLEEVGALMYESSSTIYILMATLTPPF